jgi:hypothetical protein
MSVTPVDTENSEKKSMIQNNENFSIPNETYPKIKPIILELKSITDNIVKNDNLTPENILLLTTNLMSFVGKYKNISGATKKKIVIYVINDAIRKYIENETLETLLVTIMENVMPSAIDLLVDISKRKYKFKGSKFGNCISNLNCC